MPMSSDSVENVEHAATFGNYLIHGIDEIILPPAIDWLPLAVGWKVLGLIILLLLLWQGTRLTKLWWRNAYRREALRQLDRKAEDENLQAVVALLPHYLKVTALYAFARQDVASLAGKDWLEFLDSHYDGPSFSNGLGQKLLSISYLPPTQWSLDEAQSKELIKMSRQWIASHRQSQHV